MLAVSDPQGEDARLHAQAITSSDPYWPSVVPAPKRGLQHLPLVVLMVHHGLCPGGAAQGPVTPPARDTHLDGAPMDKGYHTPPDFPWGPGHAT